MDNTIARDLLLDFDNLAQCEISIFLDLTINLCQEYYFGPIESVQILLHLNKLKGIRVHFGNKDHSSISILLGIIANMIEGTSLSCLALPFLLEQLRIEKLYLGHHHPDLAFILFSIGQIYEAYDKLKDAINYLNDAFCLLNKHQRKGQLYANVIYKVGKVKYRQSLYKDAMKHFNLAIIEQQAAFGEFHPAVAEMQINIGKLQLEIGKLQDAMKNFLGALLITRMVFGNNHAKVAECLYGIGLIHEARAEFTESINVLSQALRINENAQDDDDDILSLHILHRMGLIYQSKDMMDKAAVVFQNLKNRIKLKVDEDDIEGLFTIFGYLDDEHYPLAAAAA